MVGHPHPNEECYGIFHLSFRQCRVRKLACKGFRTHACSERTYKRNVFIRSFESQGDERWSAELDGCTSEPISVVLFIGERVA